MVAQRSAVSICKYWKWILCNEISATLFSLNISICIFLVTEKIVRNFFLGGNSCSAFEFGWPFGALVWVESVKVSMGARRLLWEQGIGKHLNWTLIILRERISKNCDYYYYYFCFPQTWLFSDALLSGFRAFNYQSLLKLFLFSFPVFWWRV